MAPIHKFTCIYLLPILLTLLPHAISRKCPCSSSAGCNRPSTDKYGKEVFVVTNGKSDFTKWEWDSLTVVIATNENKKTEVMCYAHQKGRKYGFITKMPVDASETSWSADVKDRYQGTTADIVAVDLVDILAFLKTSSNVSTDALRFDNLLKQTYMDVHKDGHGQVVCVVPWKPPCFGSSCEITNEKLYHYCDLIMIDGSSFEVMEEGDACKARATVPMAHLALGVDEYIADGITEQRIVLGVPWHGYKYTCQDFIYKGKQDSPCKLIMKDNNGTKSCDVAGSRTYLPIGAMLDQYNDEVMSSHWSSSFQAPVFTHYSNGTSYQVWYENIMSLRNKYQYAHDFYLKGIAIYYAEDLSNSTSLPNKGFTGGMWDWVLHSILKKVVTQPPPVKYHGGVVAGAAIGCLLLGLVLGVAFTCLALRHRVKKSNREVPFKRDQNEYHDDDDNLHL